MGARNVGTALARTWNSPLSEYSGSPVTAIRHVRMDYTKKAGCGVQIQSPLRTCFRDIASAACASIGDISSDSRSARFSMTWVEPPKLLSRPDIRSSMNASLRPCLRRADTLPTIMSPTMMTCLCGISHHIRSPTAWACPWAVHLWPDAQPGLAGP